MIENQLGHPVQLEKGGPGQFDVFVNGQSVASRKGGLVAKMLGRPWPTDEEVLDAVRAAVPESSAPD